MEELEPEVLVHAPLFLRSKDCWGMLKLIQVGRPPLGLL